MKMPGVQAEQRLARGRIGKIEVVGAWRVALCANAEKLALDGHFMMLAERSGNDLVQGLDQSFPRANAIRGIILVPIRNPDIHHRRSAQLHAKILADAAARQAVIDPEPAHSGIRMAQRRPFAERMREAGGIEVQAPLMLFGPLYPLREMLRFNDIPLHRLVRFEVNRMKIEPLLTRNLRHRNFKVSAQS